MKRSKVDQIATAQDA